MPTRPTVFVIDDDDAVRDSLRFLIASADLDVKTYASAQDFLDAHEPGRLGCMLVDVRMPGMSGLELQKELPKRKIDLPVIIITGHGDVPMAVSALKAGAFDFIEKPLDDELLLKTVRRAIDESRSAARARARLQGARDRLQRLTERERQVLDMVIAGETNKAIAHKLGISHKTVEAHRAHVMEKTGSHSLAELIKDILSLQSG